MVQRSKKLAAGCIRVESFAPMCALTKKITSCREEANFLEVQMVDSGRAAEEELMPKSTRTTTARSIVCFLYAGLVPCCWQPRCVLSWSRQPCGEPDEPISNTLRR